MSFKLASLTSLLAASGVWFAAQVDEAPLDARMAQLGAGEACGIDVVAADEGVVLTAWSEPGNARSWRMVVTQSMGSGGFDLVQSGDVTSFGEGAVILSDMELDMDAAFTARLTTWNAAGETLCRIGTQV